jgi:hypothetical protein
MDPTFGGTAVTTSGESELRSSRPNSVAADDGTKPSIGGENARLAVA